MTGIIVEDGIDIAADRLRSLEALYHLPCEYVRLDPDARFFDESDAAVNARREMFGDALHKVASLTLKKAGNAHGILVYRFEGANSSTPGFWKNLIIEPQSLFP